MKKCDVCSSEKIRKQIINVVESDLSKNVIEYTCGDCNHKHITIEPIDEDVI